MKTKTYITALLCLISNVATAVTGSVNAGYASDYFRRGAVISAESVQSNVLLQQEIAGIELSLGGFTNQPIASGGADTYIIAGGASKQLGELFTAYVGLEHAEQVSSSSILDAKLGLRASTLLNPAIVIYRNLDEDLYTFELSVGHEFDLEVAKLGLNGLVGNTDLTTSTSESYFGIGAEVSKAITENASLTLSYDYVDSDLIVSKDESIFGLSASVSF